jgi:hypothetical protein
LAILTNLIDAIRRIGSPTQQAALRRQDSYAGSKEVKSRRLEMARSVSGTAEQFVATVGAEPEQIRPMNADELEAINDNGALLNRFFEVFLERVPLPWCLEDLDAAFSSWARASNQDGYDDEAVVQILGASFGQHCARTLDMTWVVVTDSHGSAAALRGAKKDYRAFPFHSIRKRIHDREEGFFKPVYIAIEAAAASDDADTLE